jgi:hypothetical protein
MKMCAGLCGKELDEENFGKDRTRRNGLREQCKSCRNEKAAQTQVKSRERMKMWFDEQKNKPCMDCGRKFPTCCMDFDHTGEDKVEIVSRLVGSMAPKERILAEIAKCDLICANCHRIRTFLSGRYQCGAKRKYDRSKWAD